MGKAKKTKTLKKNLKPAGKVAKTATKTAAKKSAKKAVKKPALKSAAKAKPSVAKKTTTKSATAKAQSTKVIKWAEFFSPLDNRLVLSVEGPAQTTAGGIIIPGNVADRPNQGKVLAAGQGRRNKKGLLRPLDVRVGDRVLFQQYAGTPITFEGTEYLIVREDELLGILNS